MRVTVFARWAFALSLSLVGLTGCNTAFFSPAPTITSFTASPTAVTVGGTASLTGVFADGTGMITPGNIAVTSGTAVSVTPTQTTTYILTVTNKSGSASTQTATVTVNPLAPAITSFAANPTAITVGESASLTGVFANGTGVITPGNIPATSGTAITVTPAYTKTYTLTVTNSAGATATKTVLVTATPAAPSISSFTANQVSITAGTSVNLTGVFANGTGVITPGNITATSGMPMSVLPTGTTTYTLTVINSVGVVATKTATVTVNAVVPVVPTITSFVASPASITAGGTYQLTGVFANGTGVITPGNITATNGTAVTVTLSDTTTYTLTVTNSAGVTAFKTATVTLLAAQSITFANPGTQTVGTPLTLSATASSGLTVAFASTTTSVCTVSGTTATFVSVGTCTIQATQPGNATYAAATPVSQSFTVNAAAKTAQTITFANPGTQTVGTPLTLSATASSGLTVAFASTTTSVCTVSGTTATFVSAGTCTIQATQPGNATYAAATPVTQSFSVLTASSLAQTITFGTIPAQTVGTALILTASASSGLPISYTSTTGSVCTITGVSSATLNAAGTCTIQANQAGNSTYAAAPQVTQSFTVNAATPKSQTITFGPIASQTAGTTLVLTATASSGLAVSYTTNTPSVCTITGASSVTLDAAGACTVQANQAGNSFYLSATPVSQSITVAAAQPATATITSFTASSNTVALGSQVTLSWVVTGATSLVINQQVGNVTGTSVNVTPLATGANVYTLTANSANGPVTKSLTINVTNSSAPTINSFTASAPTVMAGSPVTLAWAVTGANTISISPAVGTVSGTSTTATPASAGSITYTLTATNSSGSSTSSVVVVVTSTLQPPVVSLSALSSTITLQGTVQLSWTESGATSLSIDQGVGSVPVTSNSINTTPTASGPITYTITATNGAGSTTSSVTVNVIAAPAAPTATVPYPRISAAGTGYTVGSPITLNYTAPGATSLSIDQGVGPVTGTSATVTPTTAGLNTYTLTASNGAGSASAFVTVNVGPVTPVPTAPVINSFTAANSAIAQGGSVTLTWSVTGATSLSIDQGVGAVSKQSVNVTPANLGSNTYTLTVTNAAGNTTAQVTVVTSTTAPTPQPTQIADCTALGMSAICVPYMSDVLTQAWGVGGSAWPDQLFWQDVPFNQEHYYDMLLAADSIASGGRVPVGGNVAWGFDLLNANGGDPDFADYSQQGGYMQYAAWMNPREGTYFALGPDGTISYPGQGYVSFSMPMLADDLPEDSQPETFGKWAGESLGNLAVTYHLRGFLDADFFIGVYSPDDWHPRLINSFESWAGVTVPGTTVPARANYVSQNLNSEWIDFVNAGQVSFLTEIDNTLLANGVTPFSGGQLNFDPALSRVTGSDPRAWETQIPGKYWYFVVENESQGDRSTPSDWTASYSIGASASRVPDVPMGVDMDGFCNDSVLEAALYNKHLWLSAGWTYIANRDGSIRRASQVFQRNNWDAQTACADQVAVMREHVPTHPFGPAFYYSDNVARYFESPNNETNYYYFCPYLQRSIATLTASSPQPQYYGVAQGINLGYWVSDAVDPSTLKAADVPSAWLLYDSNRLPADELTKLKAVAPVYDLMNAGGSGKLLGATAALAAGPVHATGTGLNMLSFVDQNGSVILMVTNQDATDQNAGALVFNNVSNGNFNLLGLLGTPSTTMTVTNNSATVPISVAAYDTAVYEIPALRWIGH